jgi:hypothetical protein
MPPRARSIAWATTAFTVALSITACSGDARPAPVVSESASASESARTESTTTTTAVASSAADPNAPEVNAAGDIPDNQVFVTFTDPAGPFTVKVPEGWASVDANGAVTFSDKFNSIGLSVTAAAAAPTIASANQSEVPAIRAASTNFSLGDVTTVQRAGGQAVLITYHADSANEPVTGKTVSLAFERYEFWQNGKEAILVLAGPVGADNVDPWRTVTDSFAWA